MDSLSILSLMDGGVELALQSLALLVCVKYRRISRSMSWVMVGLASGLIVSIWGFVRSWGFYASPDESWSFYPASGDWSGAFLICLPAFISSAAKAVFIVGLAGMLKDVHSRLSPAKDSFDDNP